MEFWRNKTLRFKLFTLFFIILLLFVLGFTMIFNQVNTINEEVDTFQTRNDATILVNEIQQRVNTIFIEVLDYDRSRTINRENVQGNQNRLNEIFTEMEAVLETAVQKEEYQKMRNKYLMYEDEVNEFLQARSPITDKEVIARIGQLSNINIYRNHIIIGGEELMNSFTVHLSESASQVNSAITNTRYILLGSLLVAILVGTALIIFFSNSISKRLNQVLQTSEDISKGNLSVSKINITARDEIGKLGLSVNEMSENLRLLIDKISISSQQVAASTEQLTESAHETGIMVGHITESIQHVAVTSEKQLSTTISNSEIATNISKSMEEINRNVRYVSRSSLETAQTADAGNEVIEMTIEQMKSIFEKTNTTAEVVEQLGKKSSEIGQIVSLISSVSDQTNLLALNAAIEAARAGEHGKGFAVVANEVRMLAEQSRNAASQISELIKGIQGDIQYSVTSMGEGRTAVEEGMVLVEKAGGTFSGIYNAVNNVTGQIENVTSLIEEISLSTEELAETFNETKTVVEEAAGHTQSVAATAEEQNASMQEMVSATQTLATMAEDLQEAVSNFKL